MSIGTDAKPVDVHAMLEGKSLSAIQRRVLILATLTIVLEGFDIQLVAFTAPAILAEWGISKATLGVVMSAALVGMVFGAAAGGYFGDRLGRRVTLIASTAVFSIATLAAAFAGDVTVLAGLRAIAGLGFGAALPNAAALVAEFMPERIRARSVAVVIIGVPCGGMLGAALASWVVPTFGWQWVFIVGGCLPLALAAVCLRGLPESLGFTSTHRDSKTRVAELLTREFRRTSLGLWLAFLASLACGYAFFSWIPTALATLDLPVDVAIRGSFYYNLFGVCGALAGCSLVPYIGSRAALLLLLSIGIAATLALSGWLAYASDARLPISVGYLMTALSFSGVGSVGAQAALYALAAHAYPTWCRAMGIGSAASVGRIGAIASAYGGGAVLAWGAGPSTFFLSLAVLLVITAIGILIVDRHVVPA